MITKAKMNITRVQPIAYKLIHEHTNPLVDNLFTQPFIFLRKNKVMPIIPRVSELINENIIIATLTASVTRSVAGAKRHTMPKKTRTQDSIPHKSMARDFRLIASVANNQLI